VFNWLKCETCERLKAENEYLKKLIDNLLMSRGVNPVIPNEETILEETEEEKKDRALSEKGVLRYGE